MTIKEQLCNAGQASFTAHKSRRRKKERWHSGATGGQAGGPQGLGVQVYNGGFAPIYPLPFKPQGTGRTWKADSLEQSPTMCADGLLAGVRAAKLEFCCGREIWTQLHHFDVTLSKRKIALIIE